MIGRLEALLALCCALTHIATVDGHHHSVPALAVLNSALFQSVSGRRRKKASFDSNGYSYRSDHGDNWSLKSFYCSDAVADCDPKFPANVAVCDTKKRGGRTSHRTYCTDLSVNFLLRRRLEKGKAHCGACPSCSKGPFPSSVQLQNAVDQYLAGACTEPVIGTWNVSGISNFTSLFDLERNINASKFNDDISMWDMSSATTTHRMFYVALSFNQPLNTWDTANIVDMSNMFYAAMSFDQDIRNWDVSHVEKMDHMFCDAPQFNQPLYTWNTSKVQDMSAMFNGATSFDQDIQHWDVSSVQTMGNMFGSATQFNQPLNPWNTSKVQDMSYMFSEAISFDQAIENWNVSAVQTMESMFDGAASFNQDLSRWRTSNVKEMQFMFSRTLLFNSDISSWDISKVNDFYDIFEDASGFNRNLCSWGASIQSTAHVRGMFSEAGCQEQDDPDLSAALPGPFCYPCSCMSASIAIKE